MLDRTKNLWWATAPRRTPAPALTGSARADVAVIGGGIMGASAALALAEAGVDVAVLEGGEVGEGASSRPGGFIVPHFSVGSPDEVRARLGDVLGDAMLRLVGGSASAVFDRIATLGLDCDAAQGGWYHPAHAPAAMERVRAIADQWEALGFAGELVGAEATAERTGARGYLGSWFAPSGGTLHPLKYCRGLMDAAVARGARLFEQSRVLAIEPEAGGYRLRTDGGALTVERVLVCTNGFSAALVPAMTATIVPLRVWQCATAPLPLAWRERLFARGECLSDTRRNLFTYRFDAEGRLITGALDTFGVSPARAAAAMAARLRAMLDLPATPRITHLWRGDSSLSASRLPATLVRVSGIVSATACNARGIALSTVVGEALARHTIGGPPPPIPLIGEGRGGRANARLQGRLSRFYPHLAPLLDWADARRRSRGRL